MYVSPPNDSGVSDCSALPTEAMAMSDALSMACTTCFSDLSSMAGLFDGGDELQKRCEIHECGYVG